MLGSMQHTLDTKNGELAGEFQPSAISITNHIHTETPDT